MHAEHADRDRLNDLSGHVIGCAFMVLNTLGIGFLEKVYENALAYELRSAGFAVVQQCTNYLKATGLRLCLLLNFGKQRLEIKRVVHGL